VSTPGKPRSDISWRTIGKVADRAERQRIKALSEQEIDAELRKAGIDPNEAAKLVERAIEQDRSQQAVPAAVPTPPRVGAKVLPLRRRAPVWFGVAAAAAAVLIALGRKQPVNVASGTDADTADIPRAVFLRQQAYAACDERHWTACRAGLDEAARIDPEGETDPKVIAVRRAIRDERGD
jgi:type II secretory pathway component PulK